MMSTKRTFLNVRGVTARQKIRREFLSDLRPGVILPKNIEVGHLLSLDPKQGGRHLLRILAEDGVVVGRSRGRRVVIDIAAPKHS